MVITHDDGHAELETSAAFYNLRNARNFDRALVELFTLLFNF
jgi:hypothetical protein